MIVEIPFAYTAKIIRARCQKEEDVTVEDRIPFRLNAIPADQVRPAAVLTDGPDGHRTTHRFAALATGGFLWQRAEFPEGGIQAALDARRLVLWSPNTGMPRPPVLLPHEGVRQRVRDNRERIVDAVRMAAAHFVVTPTAAFKPSCGPCWKISHDLKRLSAEREYEPGPRVFRADRFAEALAQARALRAAAGLPPDPKVEGAIEVIDPGAFAAIDDDWDAFLRAADNFVRFTKGAVGDWPRPHMLAFADLRDAWRASGGSDWLDGGWFHPETARPAFDPDLVDLTRAVLAMHGAPEDDEPDTLRVMRETLLRLDRGPVTDAAPEAPSLPAPGGPR